MRVAAEELRRLDLRAHALLADVPLHDVWAVDLGGPPGRTILDLKRALIGENLAAANPAVKALFAFRWWLGRVLGWDRERAGTAETSYAHRLTPEDRQRTLVTPGTKEGPFTVLFVSKREAISEIQNATVHGFSVLALDEHPSGYRLYWAIYVRPVGPLTRAYMLLIDPFRRFIVYPAVLRRIAAAWER
ncbi:MAG TPA: DUF2867 domain-containing protein [Candidatus Polarisedimenticolaceae bacterium]|nr:DUF2867 domain-containing protein [Candidatus Polarisedimenticolaceae bacterium]